MKDYFIQLFEYDKYANELIYECIISAGSPEKPVQLMAHLFATQQAWLNRCQRLPASSGSAWPDWRAEQFTEINNSNHAKWIAYLQQLTAEDFSSSIHYKNFQGDEFTNKLSDLLAHVINHGTHHRAQAGQWLKMAGIEKLPPTDYIFYIREHK